MAVYKRNKYWTVQFMFDGKTYVRSSKSTRKADAIELESKMRQEIINNELGHRDSIHLQDALSKWIPTARKSAAYALWKEHFGNPFLEDITPRDYERFIQAQRERGIQDSTLRLWTIQFGAFLKHFDKLEYKVPKISLPKFKLKKAPIRYLTTEEEQRLIQALREVDPVECVNKNRAEMYDYVCLMLDTGTRPREMDKLAWKDIDFVNKVIRLYRPKVGNQSVIPMTERACSILQQRYKKRQTGYVFSNNTNTGHKSNGNEAFRSACQRANLKGVTPHTLRKTFASRLVSAGVPLFTVSKLLGHSSVAVTQSTYAHLVPDEQFEKAIEMLNNINTKKGNLRIVGG